MNECETDIVNWIAGMAFYASWILLSYKWSCPSASPSPRGPLSASFLALKSWRRVTKRKTLLLTFEKFSCLNLNGFSVSGRRKVSLGVIFLFLLRCFLCSSCSPQTSCKRNKSKRLTWLHWVQSLVFLLIWWISPTIGSSTSSYHRVRHPWFRQMATMVVQKALI